MSDRPAQAPLLLPVDSPRPPAGRNAFLIVKRKLYAKGSTYTANEIAVAFVVADHMRQQEDGRLIGWPGVERIVEQSKLSDKTVRQALRSLVERHGLFERVDVPGRPRDRGRPSCAFLLVEEFPVAATGNLMQLAVAPTDKSNPDLSVNPARVSGKSGSRLKEGTAYEPLTNPTPISPPHGAGTAALLTHREAAAAADRIAARVHELTGRHVDEPVVRGWRKRLRRGSREIDLLAAVEASARREADAAAAQDRLDEAHRAFYTWLKDAGGEAVVVPQLAEWTVANWGGRAIDGLMAAAVALGAPTNLRDDGSSVVFDARGFVRLVEQLRAQRSGGEAAPA